MYYLLLFLLLKISFCIDQVKNNNSLWTEESLINSLPKKYNSKDYFFIDDSYNYLSEKEKSVIIGKLNLIYNYFSIRTFVIILNSVSTKYEFSYFSEIIINNTFLGKNKRLKDPERSLFLFLSVEDKKSSLIRGLKVKELIRDREVSEIMLRENYLLSKKEIFYAVDNILFNILAKHQKKKIPFKIICLIIFLIFIIPLSIYYSILLFKYILQKEKNKKK